MQQAGFAKYFCLKIALTERKNKYANKMRNRTTAFNFIFKVNVTVLCNRQGSRKNASTTTVPHNSVAGNQTSFIPSS